MVSAAFVIGISLAMGVATESKPVRAELQIKLRPIQIVFGERLVKGEAAILTGEALEFEIGLVNQRVRGPATTAAEVDWFDRIVVSIRPGGRRETGAGRQVRPTCVSLQRRGVGRTDELLLIERGAFDLRSCRIDVASLGLKHGRHTIAVNWSAAVEKTGLRDVGLQELPQQVEFELREIRSPEDELDFAYHRAVTAFRAGRLADARRHIERVLERAPLSPSALITRGRIRTAGGDCHGAAADWRAAAGVLEYEAGLAVPRPGAVEDPRGAAAALRDRADRLNCR